jgi:hypothetical protein
VFLHELATQKRAVRSEESYLMLKNINNEIAKKRVIAVFEYGF